jgi:hypothetical protein
LIAHRFVNYAKENKNIMGTRGLTKIIKNDALVVAQYGQWDHYPSGQGLTALNFLRDENNIANLEKNLNLLYYPTKDEIETISSEEYPSFSRDTGAGILELIANSTGPVPIFLDTDFENDELFCEGVYTIDLSSKLFTTKYDGKEYAMTFDMAKDITDEIYLTLSGCHVYQYEIAAVA